MAVFNPPAVHNLYRNNYISLYIPKLTIEIRLALITNIRNQAIYDL